MGDPCRDVTGMTAEQAHATALAVLDERTGRAQAGGWQGGRDLEGYAGRRRILERHAPRRCTTCAAAPHVPDVHHVDQHTGRHYWPSPDYLDAAAGLITGLPDNPEATP